MVVNANAPLDRAKVVDVIVRVVNRLVEVGCIFI